MRRGLALAVVLALASATAALAGVPGTVAVSLTPARVSSASMLSVSAMGPFSGVSGLPISAVIQVQKGFSSSARSVAVLCTAKQASNSSCPSQSKIGHGTAVATGSTTVLGLPVSRQDTINLKLFLGIPQAKGDIAAVVIVGTDTLFSQTLSVTGRLFKPPDGSLELLFSQFPSIPLPSGVTVTLDQLDLTVHATRSVTRTITTGKRKHKQKHKHTVRYSLITNPSKCNGQWTGAFTLTFAGGMVSKALSAPCSTH